MSNDVALQAPTTKRLAIFLDGTWNTVNDNTSVWRLKALCVNRSKDGRPQLQYYDAGVGTGPLDRFLGGAFGYGVSGNIIDAYKWLIDNYEDGDEIFIFGFSRGAYTARALSGLISICGLLKLGCPISIKEATGASKIAGGDRLDTSVVRTL